MGKTKDKGDPFKPLPVKELKKADKAAARQHEAREEARSILVSGFAALLQDDTMKSRNPAAVSMAGFMLNYIGNRRYEDVGEDTHAEDILLAMNDGLIDPA